MTAAVTNGVRVEVETSYVKNQSNPLSGFYLFSYRIVITNEGDSTLQLLRRHWIITDANGVYSEVEGEGVIGVQPVIKPRESYEYMSGCNLNTDIGRMKGTYQMVRLSNGKKFRVQIPEFLMVAPHKQN